MKGGIVEPEEMAVASNGSINKFQLQKHLT
jgi:hypothetical protein